MPTRAYDNTFAHEPVNGPGKPTGDGETIQQPADTGATSTKVQKAPAQTDSSPDAIAATKFTAPETSPLKAESSHMPGSGDSPLDR